MNTRTYVSVNTKEGEKQLRSYGKINSPRAKEKNSFLVACYGLPNLVAILIHSASLFGMPTTTTAPEEKEGRESKSSQTHNNTSTFSPWLKSKYQKVIRRCT